MAGLNFSTSTNYQKRVMQGSFTVTVTNPAFKSDTTITHNLGYVPNIRVWYTNASGEIAPAVGLSTDGTTGWVGYNCYFVPYVDTVVITFNKNATTGPSRTSTIYYRIYADATV